MGTAIKPSRRKTQLIPVGNSYYCPLEQESLLHISGEQALQFLQGQLSCDTRKLGPRQSLPGLYCTVQGRVVCDFLLCQLAPEQFALRLRRDIHSSSAALLAKYIIFSKARIIPENDDWQLLGCWGDGVGDVLRECLGQLPTGKYASCGGENFLLVQVDDHGQQFECYLKRAPQAGVIQELQTRLQLASEPHWQALQIRNGVARIELKTSGEFIPQMLNYDITGHISFNKGCYTGQEVVARMHYKGKPKRRMYLARVDVTEPATAGSALYASRRDTTASATDAGADTARSVGNIVNCAGAADQQLWALLVATREGINAGLHLHTPDGPELTLAELPYSVPNS